MNQKIDIKLFLVIPVVLGLGILFLINPSSTLQNATPNPLPTGTIVFGPETFVRDIKAPKIIRRTFAVENFSGHFSILIENGKVGENLVSSAIIRLNDSEIFGTNDFNQKVFNLTRDILLQRSNLLEVELRGIPKSQLAITILKPFPNPVIANSAGDFRGSNFGDFIHFSWSETDRTDKYVLFRSLSQDGPWIEIGDIPGSLGNGVDATPETRATTLCYRLEARDANGVVLRNYKLICVPQFVEVSSHELKNLGDRTRPDSMCLTTDQFINTNAMSLEAIKAFLNGRRSFLRTTIEDVDGVKIDPPQIIFDTARAFSINPQVILTTLQKEKSAIKATTITNLDTKDLKRIMGFDGPSTIRDQIRDGTAQFQRDLDRLARGEFTLGGWKVGVTKESGELPNNPEGVFVNPLHNAVASLFSYTPWVGGNSLEGKWGGKPKVGGNSLFCAVWASFDFPIPPQRVTLNPATDITATSLKLSWILPQFPDPDFLKYKIFRSTSPGVTENSTLVETTTTQSQTEFVDTALTPNSTFFYKVFVFDKDEFSTPSNEVSATTLFFPSGTWTPAANMATARFLHTSTLLPNGKVLVAGGQITSGIGATNSTELYDPQGDAFAPSGGMNFSREAHTSTLLNNGKVLIAGGFDVVSHNTGELYDSDTETFSVTGNMTIARRFHTATLLLDGAVLIIGGDNRDVFGTQVTLSSAEIYDPQTNTFTPVGSMNVRRRNHTATLLHDGRILAVGGDDAGGQTPDNKFTAEIYDPSTQTFGLLIPILGGRFQHTSTLLSDNTVLLAGATFRFPSAELFNPATSLFENVVGQMIQNRRFHTATRLQNGEVFLVGGFRASPELILNSAELYDLQTKTFQSTGNMHTERTVHSAVLLPDGRVLVTGGLNLGSIPESSAELYNP